MGGKKNSNSRRVKKSGDGGRRIKAPSHPPSFTAVPWYNLTLRLSDITTSVTSINIQAALASQLNVSFAASFVNLRFLSVAVWGALLPMNSTNSLSPLSVVVYDPIASTFNGSISNRTLEALVDYPDQVRRACVAYRYPKAQREVSFNAYNLNATTLFAVAGAGPGSVMYIRLQWRAATFIPVPSEMPEEKDFDVIDDDHSIDRSVERIMKSQLVRMADGTIGTLADKFNKLGFK